MDAYAKSKRATIVDTLALARRSASSPVGAAMTGLAAARHRCSESHGHPGHRTPARTRPRVRSDLPCTRRPARTSGRARFIGRAGRDHASGTPKPAKLPTRAVDPAEGRRLWAVSEQLTGAPFDVEAGAAIWGGPESRHTGASARPARSARPGRETWDGPAPSPGRTVNYR